MKSTKQNVMEIEKIIETIRKESNIQHQVVIHQKYISDNKIGYLERLF